MNKNYKHYVPPGVTQKSKLFIVLEIPYSRWQKADELGIIPKGDTPYKTKGKHNGYSDKQVAEIKKKLLKEGWM